MFGTKSDSVNLLYFSFYLRLHLMLFRYRSFIECISVLQSKMLFNSIYNNNHRSEMLIYLCANLFVLILFAFFFWSILSKCVACAWEFGCNCPNVGTIANLWLLRLNMSLCFDQCPLHSKHIAGMRAVKRKFEQPDAMKSTKYIHNSFTILFDLFSKTPKTLNESDSIFGYIYFTRNLRAVE